MAAAPDVIVLGQPFVLVHQPVAPPAIVVAVGTQGPPGRNGVDGATISPDPNNQIQNRPNGLYVPPTEWGGTEW